MDSQGMATDEAIESGDLALTAPEQRTVDALFSATYEELRRLASTVRRADQNTTLSPTTLVNEAWLKLSVPRIDRDVRASLQTPCRPRDAAGAR
jgi:hypothetical protein